MPAPPWFSRNRKIAARNARLHKLKRAGLLPVMSKAELRAQAIQAVASHGIIHAEQDKVVAIPHDDGP